MSNITAVTPFALTAKGHALQLKVQAGMCKLELVGVKIGDGYLQEGQTIESLTALVHEIPTADGSAATQSPIATLAEVYKDTDKKGRERVMVHVYIKNGNNDDTRITECAILAKDTDGSTIIYGALNLGGSSMPFDRYNGTTPIVYNWKFPLYISNEANINMDFGFVAGVSREDFDAHTGDNDNPHNVTAEQLGLGNVIADISKIGQYLQMAMSCVAFGRIVELKENAIGTDEGDTYWIIVNKNNSDIDEINGRMYVGKFDGTDIDRWYDIDGTIYVGSAALCHVESEPMYDAPDVTGGVIKVIQQYNYT